MTYRKYLVTAFVAALFLPVLSAKSTRVVSNELNLNSVDYVELEEGTELGFDTSVYLPENFDPYSDDIAVNSINYIEEEEDTLDFDVQEYLPENFDAYQK